MRGAQAPEKLGFENTRPENAGLEKNDQTSLRENRWPQFERPNCAGAIQCLKNPTHQS